MNRTTLNILRALLLIIGIPALLALTALLVWGIYLATTVTADPASTSAMLCAVASMRSTLRDIATMLKAQGIDAETATHDEATRSFPAIVVDTAHELEAYDEVAERTAHIREMNPRYGTGVRWTHDAGQTTLYHADVWSESVHVPATHADDEIGDEVTLPDGRRVGIETEEAHALLSHIL